MTHNKKNADRFSRYVMILALILASIPGLPLRAQTFFNLTADEVRIDSVLPCFSHSWPLPKGYEDSVYTVHIDYPEFIGMSAAAVSRVQSILGTADPLPALPTVETGIGIERHQATLTASFVPLVKREGQWQKLVSFKLTLTSQPHPASSRSLSRASEPVHTRYADHSVLATGRWAKISVPATGVYQLTEQLVRQAGFSNINKVKIYGYGGALQPEILTDGYLRETDDLSEVPQCIVGNRHFFHATGPVTWDSPDATVRTRNPYSNVGCYFLTENDEEPLTQDSATFVASFYPSNDDYHSLYEVDDYAWYHGGRNLYDATPLSSQKSLSYALPAHTSTGRLTVALTSNGAGEAAIFLGDSLLGSAKFETINNQYIKAVGKTYNYNVSNLRQPESTVTLQHKSGEAEIHLDYIALTMPTAAPAPDLVNGSFAAPTLNYLITNQDHHADPQGDMVIIIPTSQRLLSQAQRLKQLHEQRDSLRINIVPADELMNEFSSGTPDANAYRRYLKMLYDRATADDNEEGPRYLLLMGDGAWDNRMLSSDWRSQSPDDYLLCYESENSFSATECYVADEFFALLDDGEGNHISSDDKADLGVGRLPATTEAEARIMVDKIISYCNNEAAGDWQNTICIMADDGNNNGHMEEAEHAVETITSRHDAIHVRKIYWDAYKRVTSSKGHTYPDVTRLIKQQMQAGALIMDYNGHGSPYMISHEKVLWRTDFEEQTSLRLPLWVTASCDISPFDSNEENIGETAMLNPRGGAVAFFGTTRTVYMGANQDINCAFLKHVLDSPNGQLNTLGDAVRLAKNEVRNSIHPLNKIHYQLLGDPAMRLAMPKGHIALDDINGIAVSDSIVELRAGQAVTVSGHLENGGNVDGIVFLRVRDEEQDVVCQLNKTGDEAETPFVFKDRPTTLYQGTDSIRNGHFTLTFVLPRDASYSKETGLMSLYAVNNDKTFTANGKSESFVVTSSTDSKSDGVGPNIYCYLNSPSFTNGGVTNTTPYFYAEVSDNDGINASGSSIGHDMLLIVDGDPSMTYNLNEYFIFDFGDYKHGSVGFSLPELTEGEHQLTFRAWDIMNNSSVAQLSFRVVKGLRPQCFSVACTHNPATTSTTFIVNHDRTGSQMDVTLEIFDPSGRLLYTKQETGVSTDNTYTFDWDLTTGGGSRLHTGVYLYRVLISSDGSQQASQAQKLIIL